MTAVSEKAIKPKISNPSQIDHTLALLGKGINEIPSSIEVLVKEAIVLSKQSNDKKNVFLLTAQWGFYWHRLEQYKKAEKQYVRALKLAQELEKDNFIAHIYSNLGLLNLRRNKHSNALRFLFKALSLHTEGQECFIYSNIGTAFFGQGKYEKALNFYQRAMNRTEGLEEKDKLNAYINMGVALQCLERYEEAVPYYLQSLEIMKDSELYMDRKAACFENFGEVRLMQKQYDNAVPYLQQAIDFNIQLKQIKRISVCLRLLGKAYFGQQKYDDAYQSFQKSLLNARKHQHIVEEKEVLETIIQYCKERKWWENCIDYQDQLIQLQSQYFYPEQKENVQAILSKQEEEMDVLVERHLKIEEQNQRLQQYNRELKQYAFIVAHDLKEPLCNITGFSTLLSSKYKEQLNEEVLELLQYIEGGANYMHKLLEDLLKYTTLSLNKEKVVKIDSNETLQKILTQLQPKIDAAKATVQIDILPTMSIDPKHFEWLMSQLIENALKFSDPNRLCHVYIHSYEKRNHQYIEVKDNGIGIEAEQQQKIFRIFQRLHKQHYEGTGIGLAICKKIVSLYNGEIGLQSKVDEGTAVYFSLSK